MENKIMKQRFSVKLLVLIVLLLALCVGGVLTGCGKNKANSTVNNGPNVEVSDEAALREALAIKEDRVITLTADIIITQELVVNGTKTISGDKSIIMNLHAIGKSQSVLSIADKGSLILDGPTIDGNGVANGISVRPGAAFKGVSGNVVYGYPYGMTIAGDAVLEGVVIDKAMHTGVYVEYGGNTDMTGGVVKDNIYGIAVASNAYMSISGSAHI